MKKIFYTMMAFCMATTVQANDVVTFEDVVTLEGENAVLNEDDYQRNFYDEDMGAGMFTSPNGDFVFDNFCMEDWDFYCGFSISARTQTDFVKTVPDQFNSCVGHGVNGSERYAIFYDAGSMMPPQMLSVGTTEDQTVSGFYITNTAWVVKSILEGDGYGDAFTTGDYLKLTITATNSEGETKTLDVYLADYTSENEADHYYLSDWTWVSLEELGAFSTLSFTMDSSRKNDWGVTTPTYFCMDDFNGTEPAPAVATFEDIEIGDEHHMSVSTEDDDERMEFVSGGYEFATGCIHDWSYWFFFGYANETDNTYKDLEDQWKNVVGGGYNGSANYGVGYVAAFNGPAFVTVLADEGAVVPGFYITNSAYTYSSLTNGDGYAKKFDLGDWYKLTITGYDAEKNITGTKDYYLADLRDAATAYIIDDWRYVDLSMLGKVKQLKIEASSSDGEGFDIKTPTYFCFDDFGATGEEILPEKNTEVSTAITAHNANATATARGSYDISGRQTNGLNKGVNIIRMSDGSVRKVVIK